VDDPLPLDRHHPSYATYIRVDGAARRAPTPALSAASRRDHDHPESVITFGWNGRSQSPECAPKILN
jgi:hypothetical protein